MLSLNSDINKYHIFPHLSCRDFANLVCTQKESYQRYGGFLEEYRCKFKEIDQINDQQDLFSLHEFACHFQGIHHDGPNGELQRTFQAFQVDWSAYYIQ